MLESVASAREAVRRHAWSDAIAAFREADGDEGLEAADLELWGAAAWWNAQIDDAVDALERAFARYLDADRPASAAIVALRLCDMAMHRLAFSVAGGWLKRAERLLDREPESVAHAWLALVHGLLAVLQRGDFDAGIRGADRGLELARRHRSPDVESLALSLKAQALLRRGSWSEGLELLDEATAAAGSDRLDPKTACEVYCFTIAACSDLGEYRRAGEWVEEADRWMQRRSIHGFRGLCRVHRAELKRLRGAWPEAEREARAACKELERFHLLDAIGFAYHEVGEVRLRSGDLQGADAAFEKAYEHGHVPQPGMARLLAARGEIEEASRSLARSLAGEAHDPLGAHDLLQRSRYLPARVEIDLAAGDVAAARAASEELDSIAERYESEALRAYADAARGEVLLAEDAPQEAITCLERAWRAWQRLELPYESARARTLLGRARAASGDRTTARLELRAARATFERLGAQLDLSLVDELLAGAGAGRGAFRPVSKTFMFTDIVTSTDLIGLIGDRAWQELIAWHDRALRAEIAEHGGEVVRHTGDGFFVSFEQAADAVRCAIAVQRLLVRHRSQHGFAPAVRIGLHTADASRHGSDYAGQGVHVAARVGALAEGEQILASRAAVEAAGELPVSVSEARTVTLKGVGEPLDVVVVEWA